MTKGNWERRAEMAAKRKAENKALKEAKAAGTLAATPEAVMQSLLTLDPDAEVWLNAAPEAPEPIRGTNHAPSRGPGSGRKAYYRYQDKEKQGGGGGGGGGRVRALTSGGGGGGGGGEEEEALRPLCARWLRYEGCNNRRCKFSHAHTIARLKDCCPDAEVGGEGSEGASEATEPPLEHLTPYRLPLYRISKPGESSGGRWCEPLLQVRRRLIISSHLISSSNLTCCCSSFPCACIRFDL